MDDIYDDGAGINPGAVVTPPEKPPEKKSEGAATGLLDKSFFGGKELKPGDRCEVEIDRVLDDQVLVRKVAESEYKDEDELVEPAVVSEDMMD